MHMEVRIHPSWAAVLGEHFEQDSFAELTDFIRASYRQQAVYPPAKKIFAAFDACPFDQTRVVILGQDPYHGQGQAHGLSFSVPSELPYPPSLRNIFAEVARDTGTRMLKSGDLSHWAAQGVLLLNAVLTVAAGMPNSHQGKGWEAFTDHVISCLSTQRDHLVFMLWGSYAQRKGAQIDTNKHLLLQTSHPSPFSVTRGFERCGHFSKANAYLVAHAQRPIDWASQA